MGPLAAAEASGICLLPALGFLALAASLGLHLLGVRPGAVSGPEGIGLLLSLRAGVHLRLELRQLCLQPLAGFSLSLCAGSSPFALGSSLLLCLASSFLSSLAGSSLFCGFSGSGLLALLLRELPVLLELGPGLRQPLLSGATLEFELRLHLLVLPLGSGLNVSHGLLLLVQGLWRLQRHWRARRASKLLLNALLPLDLPLSKLSLLMGGQAESLLFPALQPWQIARLTPLRRGRLNCLGDDRSAGNHSSSSCGL